MPNYNTRLSFEIQHNAEYPLTEDIREILYAIDESDSKHAPEWYQNWLDQELKGMAFEDWCESRYGSVRVNANYEIDQESLWIYGSDTPNIEMIAETIHLALRHYGINEAIKFEYSSGCSRLIPDAFRGGAAFITQAGYEVFSTSDWLRGKVDSHEKNRSRMGTEPTREPDQTPTHIRREFNLRGLVPPQVCLRFINGTHNVLSTLARQSGDIREILCSTKKNSSTWMRPTRSSRTFITE